MDVRYPDQPCGTGVLVLAGSSGRTDHQRAELLTRHGATTLALRWFGGEGQQPGPWEVPIETFTRALDALAPDVDRLAIVGVSFGAEAALLTASLDPRVDGVAAFAPSSVVWAGYDETHRRETSHWTWQGRPLPYLPIVHRRTATPDGLPRYLSTYEHSLAVAGAQDRERAAIGVERIPDLVLISGGDDQVWPSTAFAQAIVERRTRHGLATRHVTHPEAGHRTLLPTEQAPSSGQAMARGGTPAADAALGDLAWPELATVLRLNRSEI